ncbi:acyltransferase family protein [Simplicispira hankyongi]|uniref:acyltransferase family protein n=1 Tax=Simplicispira hankyongi TaxID=2315688 RepID=UPI001FE5657C|nr:acyltransferase [Simplicispira hankyongi]
MSAAPHALHAPRLNNFDAVRLMAALLVIWGHQFALMGMPVPLILGNEPGALGVIIFFALSGYLVSISWEADAHAGRFALRRVLRIWPGLLAVVLLSVLVLGPLFTTLPLRDYLRTGGTWDYLSNLWLDTRYPLPGVFEHNPLPASVNGPLWTIQLEVGCYIALALAGSLGLLRWRFSAPLALLALAAALQWRYGSGRPVSTWSFGLQYGMMFAVGASLASFRSAMLRWHGRSMALVLLAALALHAWGPQPVAGQAPLLALAAGAVILGSAATPGLTGAARHGDFSYGLYIYGFPMQQTVIALGGGALGFPVALALSLMLAFAWAVFSWRLVERPALSFKPRKARPAAEAVLPF